MEVKDNLDENEFAHLSLSNFSGEVVIPSKRLKIKAITFPFLFLKELSEAFLMRLQSLETKENVDSLKGLPDNSRFALDGASLAVLLL